VAAGTHSPAHVALGRAVRSIRAGRGWSQETLGFFCGMHRNYIGALERGETNATYGVLRRLAWGLQMPLSELVAEGEKIEREAENR
jgi:transcriptional regulator with XRE-family HTH domain